MTYDSQPRRSEAQTGHDDERRLRQELFPGSSSLWAAPLPESPAPEPELPPDDQRLRLIAIGSLHAINNCRDSLHALGYARPDEWSWPVPLVNSDIIRSLTPGEMMRILTKQVPPPGR